MRRKIFSLTMVLCLLFSTPVSASVISSGALVDGKKTVAVPVSATIESTFTVSLPPDIVLAKQGESNTYSYTAQVGVKGDTIVDSNIVVQPQSNIVVYDVTNRPANNTATPTQASDQNSYEHKDPQSVTVTQTKTVWPYSELSVNRESLKNTNVTISTDKISAGDWEGTLTFSISYGNDLPGLYNESGVMTASWDQLVSDGTIHVTDGAVTTNYSGSSNSSSDAIVGRLVIPNTVTSLDEHAFAYCSNLTSVTIPDNNIVIKSYAFGNCTSLSKVIVPTSATFKQTAGPGGVFHQCTSLTSFGGLGSGCAVEWGPSTIWAAAFLGCSSLTSVTIPNFVTSIGSDTFYTCSSLTSVAIPDSVTSIGSNVFRGCTSLTSVAIPRSVTSIGNYAFAGCTSLTAATFDNPQGWYTGNSSGAKTTALNSADLTDASTAATLLTSTYATKYWTRE